MKSESLCNCIVCEGPEALSPTAADYLACKRSDWTLCPPNVATATEGPGLEERCFWLRFEASATEWLHAGVASGTITKPVESWFGVWVLLNALHEYGDDEDGWMELTGHQLLFENLGHGGIMEGWSASAIVFGMESFLEHLCEANKFRPDCGAILRSELAAWRDRIVNFLDGTGPWCQPERHCTAVSRIFGDDIHP